MNLYEVNLIGCDDTTSFKIKLDDSQYELVKRLCTMSDETCEYSCQPIMTIVEVTV